MLCFAHSYALLEHALGRPAPLLALALGHLERRYAPLLLPPPVPFYLADVNSLLALDAGNFVERRGADLFLGGQKLRFASLNAPQLLRADESGPFEVRDTFAALAAKDAFGGVPVTRTYTLMVRARFSRPRSPSPLLRPG